MTFDFQAASKKELRAELRKLGRESGNDHLASCREFSDLAFLGAGEQALAYCFGVVDAARRMILLTDRRVLLLRKPLLQPLQQSAINLDAVQTCGVENRTFCARLRIEDSLGPRIIDNIGKKDAAVFATRMREAITERRAGCQA